MPVDPPSCVRGSPYFFQSCGSIITIPQHDVNNQPYHSSIAEEENCVREIGTLVAPTRYAVVPSDEKKISQRGDSSILPSDEAHFHVSTSKVGQTKPTCLVTTQETGYCTETATQGETTTLSHDGKQLTYYRQPYDSGAPLSVEQSEAKETLTAAVGELSIQEKRTKDKAVSDDDNTTSIPLARSRAQRNTVTAREQKAGSSPQQSQPLTPQTSNSNANTSKFFYIDSNVAAPTGSLTDDTQHKDGSAAPGETPLPSSDKQSTAASQCARDVGKVASPTATSGQTKRDHSPTSNHRLVTDAQVRGGGLHLVTSEQATDDVGMSQLTDLVVAVVHVPKLMAKSMTVNLQTHSHLCSALEINRVRTSVSGDKATGNSQGKPQMQRRIKSLNGTHPQAGCILFSDIAAFKEGAFLPLPSQQAVERSIGKGGNGTISIVYFKGLEFAVKRTHFRQTELDILATLRHDNILPLQAVMMGEEDPQRPSRHLCYHFMPRMSGDLQGYLTKVGHGALSNLLMQHKEDPTMLQLVVDNTKHILRSTLKGLAYLHSSNIVHNDVKPSNFLLTVRCGCDSPLTCNHGQNFAVRLADFDSAMDIKQLQTSHSSLKQLQTSHSSLKQLYRNSPSGTPGYRPPEYVLVATRTDDELVSERLTAADVWAFGCSVLKIFLSHSGPHTQKQMACVHLWTGDHSPWKHEAESAREVLKIALLERVYPNWPQLWDFVAMCIKVYPTDRATCWKLSNHAFFSS